MAPLHLGRWTISGASGGKRAGNLFASKSWQGTASRIAFKVMNPADSS